MVLQPGKEVQAGTCSDLERRDSRLMASRSSR
jgi:hypothetical protein